MLPCGKSKQSIVHYAWRKHHLTFIVTTFILGAGTKIEFLTDEGETLRNKYLLCKNFKTGFGFFVPRTVFCSHFGPARLAENWEPGRLGSVVN